MYVRDFLRHCASNHSAKVAYIDGERKITWAVARARSLKLASVLHRLGIRKGDAVAMLAYDHMEAMEHVFACMEIGAVRVGVNRGYSALEMVHVVEDSKSRVLIIQDACLQLLGSHIEDLKSMDVKLVVIGEGHGFPLSYETLMSEAEEWSESVAMSDTDIAAISYTSGTTGFPKGVLLKQSGIRDMLLHFVLEAGLRHEDVWLNPTSMAWVSYLLNTMSVVNGMTTVLPGRDFKAETYLDQCSSNRVTAVLAVPTMLQRLITTYEQDTSRYDLSALRLVTYGSAPATPALITSAINAFGVELMQLYGLTEFCAWVSFLRHEDHLRGLHEKPELLKSCGKPGVHCEVSFRDEDGKPVPRGGTGELWLRSETLMLGYHNQPELTAKVLDGGWLRTHDIGHQDEEGFMYLTDRSHFMIITGAANVYPSVVEQTLALHPQVREAAVVGAPHPEWGEAVVAMVSLKDGGCATASDLIRHCQGKVAKWEVPKFVEIVSEVPKGPTMKVLKKQIKERYAHHPELLPWNLASQDVKLSA